MLGPIQKLTCTKMLLGLTAKNQTLNIQYYSKEHSEP